MGVHLCPVLACATAQSTQGVTGVWPLPIEQLDLQLQTLASDMPPKAIKTGLLGSVDAVKLVAQWVDRLRADTPEGQDPHEHLALVVDPVFKASSGGQAFDSDALVTAYREHLLPRATVITPNAAELSRLLNINAAQQADWPQHARSIQAMGTHDVVITGGDTHDGQASQHALDWMQAQHAHGWLTLPRVATSHTHGTGCTFATAVAAGLALSHVSADAIVLAKMLTHHAITHGHAAGQGAGPVHALAGFALGHQHGGAPMPWLGLHEALPWRLPPTSPPFAAFTPPRDGLYGIVATGAMAQAAFQAGMNCVQLRHKSQEGLAAHLKQSVDAAKQSGHTLFINDHWQHALPHLPTRNSDEAIGSHLGVQLGVHLGQEDLCALTHEDQALLRDQATRLMLGLSSHSLWELARALGCGPSYIACGPVHPTTTKDMPWLPQGQHNLAWWVNNSDTPVVAIGGLLKPSDIAQVMRTRPAAACVVRALGEHPEQVLPACQSIRWHLADTKSHVPLPPPSLPHPVLVHASSSLPSSRILKSSRFC